MAKYTYALLGISVTFLFVVLTVLNWVEIPIIEQANFPRCDNGVVISPEFRYNMINYANERIIQGTGESYFNNHFIFKNMDYTKTECTFIVRYEYTYDELHTNMDMTIKASTDSRFDIMNINTFLRPVNMLVQKEDAIAVAERQNITYSYYNIEIDIEQQTFKYKFYTDTITEGPQIVLVVDAQSEEVSVPKSVLPLIPIV